MAKKHTISERLFREALYAVFNFGHGHENTKKGGDRDEGMKLAIRVIYGTLARKQTMAGEKANGYGSAMAFWQELTRQPEPVKYTKRQIELGLKGERNQ